MQSELKILEDRKQRLLGGLAIAKKARDEADGKMQSRYDTQKEDAAQDVAMYEALIADVDRLMARLRALDSKPPGNVVEVGRRVTIEFDDGERQDFLLLDSQGGVDLGDFQTLSTNSPVGSAVLGAEKGETVSVKLPGRDLVVRIVALA